MNLSLTSQPLFATKTKIKCENCLVFLDICLSGWLCGTRLIYWISILYLDTSCNPPTKWGASSFSKYFTYSWFEIYPHLILIYVSLTSLTYIWAHPTIKERNKGRKVFSFQVNLKTFLAKCHALASVVSIPSYKKLN